MTKLKIPEDIYASFLKNNLQTNWPTDGPVPKPKVTKKLLRAQAQVRKRQLKALEKLK